MLDAICSLIQQAFMEHGRGPEGCVMNGCSLRCVGAVAVPEAVYASAPHSSGGSPSGCLKPQREPDAGHAGPQTQAYCPITEAAK